MRFKILFLMSKFIMLKKIYLLLVLTFASFLAHSDWVLVTGNDTVSFYVETDSIKKQGNARRAWMIHDLPQRDKFGDLSNRILREFDCKEGRIRMLQFETFEQHMGRGRPTGVLSGSDVDSSWSFISPGTLDDSVLKFVCKK